MKQIKFKEIIKGIFTGRIPVRISPARMVGEVGYELLVQDKNCSNVYNHVMKIGANYNISNAGYRALNSLACEKGLLLYPIDFILPQFHDIFRKSDFDHTKK